MMKPRVSWRGMLYFPVYFLSRLYQTESAVFQNYRSIVFTKDSLLGEITTSVVVPHGGRETSLLHQYSVFIFICSAPIENMFK